MIQSADAGGVRWTLYQTGVVGQAGRWNISGENGFLSIHSRDDAGNPASALPDFSVAHGNFVGGAGVIVGNATLQGYGTLSAVNGLYDGAFRVYSENAPGDVFYASRPLTAGTGSSQAWQWTFADPDGGLSAVVRNTDQVNQEVGVTLWYFPTSSQTFTTSQAVRVPGASGGGTITIDAPGGAGIRLQDRDGADGAPTLGANAAAFDIRVQSDVFSIAGIDTATWTAGSGSGGTWTGFSNPAPLVTIDRTAGIISNPAVAGTANNRMLGRARGDTIGEVAYPWTPTELTGTTLSPTHGTTGNAIYYSDSTGAITVNLDISSDGVTELWLRSTAVSGVTFTPTPSQQIGSFSSGKAHKIIISRVGAQSWVDVIAAN